MGVSCCCLQMVLGLRLGLPQQEVYAINTLGEIEDLLSGAAPGLGGTGPLPAVEVSTYAVITCSPSLLEGFRSGNTLLFYFGSASGYDNALCGPHNVLSLAFNSVSTGGLITCLLSFPTTRQDAL